MSNSTFENNVYEMAMVIREYDASKVASYSELCSDITYLKDMLQHLEHRVKEAEEVRKHRFYHPDEPMVTRRWMLGDDPE